MQLFDVLKDSGAKLISGNTAVLSKDNVTLNITVSTVTNITNICASTKLNTSCSDIKEQYKRVSSLNNGALFPIGTYWIDPDNNELQLRMNMMVDCRPTKRGLEEVVSMISATVASAAMAIEAEGICGERA